MPGQLNLLDMEQPEMVQALSVFGEKPFRVKQLWKWLYSGINQFNNMTNLPLLFRTILQEHYTTGGFTQVQKQVSSQDETTKYLLALEDGNTVECVLMRYKYGLSACISTQVGCRMGCLFCASSALGFVRNCSVGEMVGQVLHMMTDANERITHVVLMGIGEPFDNYDAVLKLLHRLNDEEALGISYRKLTVSTCGIVPAILRFAEEGIPVNLSVSLHAPTQKLRVQTMPVAKKWPLDVLLEACWVYAEKTGRRITFEYALVKGWNDDLTAAKQLSLLCKNRLCHVNLIPVNAIVDKPYAQSSWADIRKFQKVLEDSGVATTVRRELGSDIEAACGQLRRQVLHAGEEPI